MMLEQSAQCGIDENQISHVLLGLFGTVAPLSMSRTYFMLQVLLCMSCGIMSFRRRVYASR